MHRRLSHHDYNERGIYMLTLVTDGRVPRFGQLTGTSLQARITLSPLGACVEREIQALPQRYPQLQILDYVVMPDHIHLLLFVREWMPQHLGRVVASLKAKCSQAWWQESDAALKRSKQDTLPRPVNGAPFRPVSGASAPLPSPSSPPRRPSLWEKGYHDRVLMHKGQLQTLHAYIQDNPRRLAIKRMKPDLFRIHQHLRIGGQEYASIGNIFLLKRPERLQVFMHRRATAEEIDQETTRMQQRCEEGAVLVTPGISPGEKAIVQAAIEQGMPLILLRENGFGEYEKPHGHYFEACAAGTLLVLAPWERHTDRRTISRSQCLTLNDMARTICDTATDVRLMLHK